MVDELNSENTFLSINWFYRNKKNIISLLSFLILISGFFLFKFQNQSKQNLRDWKQAHALYSSYLNGDHESLNKLQEFIKKKENLKERYQASLAQQAVFHKQFPMTSSLKKEIHSLSKRFGIYGDYAETTFLIEQNDFQKAYEKALLLKEKLDEETSSFHLTLYSLNLLRLELLAKRLNDKEKEKKMLIEIQQEPYFSLLEKKLGNEKLAFKDFINYREKVLLTL